MDQGSPVRSQKAYEAKIGPSGMPIYEEKRQNAQKNADFLSEWKQQMEIKEQKKRAEKQRLLAIERKELQQAMDFDPFGRAGAGAPNNLVN